MRPAMIDLVEKIQRQKYLQKKTVEYHIMPDGNGFYLYKNKLKTLAELAEMAGVVQSTLRSRFQRTKYRTVEEAVDAKVLEHYRRKK